MDEIILQDMKFKIEPIQGGHSWRISVFIDNGYLDISDHISNKLAEDLFAVFFRK